MCGREGMNTCSAGVGLDVESRLSLCEWQRGERRLRQGWTERRRGHGTHHLPPTWVHRSSVADGCGKGQRTGTGVTQAHSEDTTGGHTEIGGGGPSDYTSRSPSTNEWADEEGKCQPACSMPRMVHVCTKCKVLQPRSRLHPKQVRS